MNAVLDNIFVKNLLKSFSSDGRYVDNYKNRKMNRVGMPYEKGEGRNNRGDEKTSTAASKFYKTLNPKQQQKYKPILKKLNRDLKGVPFTEAEANGKIHLGIEHGILKARFESNSSHGAPFHTLEAQNEIRNVLVNYNNLNLKTGKIKKDKPNSKSLNKNVFIDGLSKQDASSLSPKQINALNKFAKLEERLDCWGTRGLYYEDGKFGFESGLGDSFEQREEKEELENAFSNIEEILNSKK